MAADPHIRALAVLLLEVGLSSNVLASDAAGQPLSLAEQIERRGCALTAEELSKTLNVSRITVFKQAKAGRIPSFRIGTCVRFDPRAVAQWLRSM